MNETKEKRAALRVMAWSMAGLIIVLLLVWFSLDPGWISSKSSCNYVKIGEISEVGYPINAVNIYADETRSLEVKYMVDLNEGDLKIDYQLD